MTALGLSELADRAWMEGGWSVVVVEETQFEATTAELLEELTFLSEDEGVGSVRVFSAPLAGPALVDALARLEADDIALLPLPEDKIADVARALDYGRGRLTGHPRGVILTSEAGVRVLAAEAPNFWSWIGPRIWSVDPLVGKLDAEARLSSLREGTGRSDAEILERAEAGTLEPDPIFAEWLILLGRGDLLGH